MQGENNRGDDSAWLGIFGAVGIFGTALSILSGLDGVVLLANAAKFIVSHWRDATRAVWQGLADLAGLTLQVPDWASRLLTVTVFIGITASTIPTSAWAAYRQDVAQKRTEKREARANISAWNVYERVATRLLDVVWPLRWPVFAAAGRNASWSSIAVAGLLVCLLGIMMHDYFVSVFRSIPPTIWGSAVYGSKHGGWGWMVLGPWIIASVVPLALAYAILVRSAEAEMRFRVRMWTIVGLVVGVVVLSRSAEMAKEIKDLVIKQLG